MIDIALGVGTSFFVWKQAGSMPISVAQKSKPIVNRIVS